MSDKKLDILIKVGVGLVFLSVLIFATNTWNTMESLLKVGILFMGSISFFGLSVFVDKKLELEKSSFMYYIIGMIFLLFGFIAIGFFEAFGEWYSFNGEGSLIFEANLFTLLSLISYGFYKRKNWFPCSIISFYLLVQSLLMLGEGLELNMGLTAAFITGIINLIYYLTKDKQTKFAIHDKIITYIMYGYSILMLEMDNYIGLISNIALLLMVIYNYLNGFKEKNKVESVFIPICILLSIIDFLITIDADFQISMLSLGFASLIAYLLLIVSKKNSKGLLYTLYSIHNVFLTISSIVFLFEEEYPLFYFLLIISSIIVSFYSKKTYKASVFSLIPKVLWLSSCFFAFIDYPNFILYSTVIIFGILSIIEKDNTKTYYIVFNSLLGLSTLIFGLLTSDTLFFGTLPLLFVANNLLAYKYYPKFKGYTWIATHVMLLLTFGLYSNKFELLTSTSEDMVNSLIGYLVCITSYLILNYYSDKKTYNNIISTIAIGLSLLLIFNDIVSEIEITQIVMTIYVMLSALYYDLKLKENVFSKILYFFALAILFKFQVIDITTIILWIICILYLILGLSDNKYKSLGIYGLSVLAVSLIVDLIEFWQEIPVYVYLFLLGVGIIVFVTIKEVKKKKEEEKK